jgi:hypothetical protein
LSEAAPALRAARSARIRPRRRAPAAPAHRRLAGVLSIAVAAILLAGVVALNVTVLRLSVRLDRLDSERAKLQKENADLAARLSTAAASSGAVAQERLGLVPARPSYLRLPAGS